MMSAKLDPVCIEIENHRKKTAIQLINIINDNPNLLGIILRHGFHQNVAPITESMVQSSNITNSSDSSSGQNGPSYLEQAINLLDQSTCYKDSSESRTLDSGYNSESLLGSKSCVHYEPFLIFDLVNTVFQYLVDSAAKKDFCDTKIISSIKNKRCDKIRENVNILIEKLLEKLLLNQDEKMIRNITSILEIIEELCKGNHHYTISSATIISRLIAECVENSYHNVNYPIYTNLYYLLQTINKILTEFREYLQTSSDISSDVILKKTIRKSLKHIKRTLTSRSQLLKNKCYLISVSEIIQNILCIIKDISLSLK